MKLITKDFYEQKNETKTVERLWYLLVFLCIAQEKTNKLHLCPEGNVLLSSLLTQTQRETETGTETEIRNTHSNETTKMGETNERDQEEQG